MPLFPSVRPWFHGSNDFHGKVDNSFDPQHGYSGAMPKAWLISCCAAEIL